MAPAAPWTVKTTKRQSSKITPASSKRRRISLPPEIEDDVRARRQRQQTLIQIQRVPSRSVNFEEGELEPLEVETEPRSRTGRRVPALKKRNSTLTQMDFLKGRPTIEISEQDLMALPVTGEKNPAVPQVDGNYDSPRKPRPSKTPGAGVRAGTHRKRKSVSLPADDSQEYLPTSKRRKGKTDADAEEASEGRRRRSGRNASKLPSNPAKNFAVFQEALADNTPRSTRPALEIEDSTGFDEDLENGEPSQQDRLSQAIGRPACAPKNRSDCMDEVVEVPPISSRRTAPRTPQKERQYIPSSQSPESLPPSTRKKDATVHSTHGTTPKRNPLGELSTNTPNHRYTIKVDDLPLAKSISKRKRKICTLKLPSVPPVSVKQRVEDSQADIWAVQPTSSLKKNGNSQIRAEDVLRGVSFQREQLEVPSTSQVQMDAVAEITSSPPQPAEVETQESLISLSEIFGVKRKGVHANQESELQQPITDPGVRTRDFVKHPQQTPQKKTQYVAFLQTQPEDIDSGDEFGSPLANDTQFAAHLAHVPASSLRTSDPLEELNPHDTIRIPSSSPPDGASSSSPLPAPILVDRVEYQNSTTTIPTKNVSSPNLPPMPPPTQRPVAPASLPHPSQISTQDPSQQLPQLSSVSQRSPDRTQRITIKDSSSMHEHLSQLPEYNADELQLQRELESTQHRASDEDDDEDFNDDLDAKTPRKTVRFGQPQQRAELLGAEATVQVDSSPKPGEDNNAPDPSPPANFTQNGHVTAARIEDMRKRGLIPPGYNPPAYKVPSSRELLPAWMFEDDDDEL